jgi:hypothetical protein
LGSFGKFKECRLISSVTSGEVDAGAAQRVDRQERVRLHSAPIEEMILINTRNKLL